MTIKQLHRVMKPGIVYRVFWESRDLGYGTDNGIIAGYWTGEVDTWGKHTIASVDGQPTVYLFTDEIYDVEPTNLLAPTLRHAIGGGF